MARSRVGENQGFLNDADFVDGLKITVFIGAYITARHAINETLDPNTAMGKIWEFYQGLIGLSKATLDPKMMTFANSNLKDMLLNSGDMVDKIGNFSLALQAAQLLYDKEVQEKVEAVLDSPTGDVTERVVQEGTVIVPGYRYDKDRGLVKDLDVVESKITMEEIKEERRKARSNRNALQKRLDEMIDAGAGNQPQALMLIQQLQAAEKKVQYWDRAATRTA